MEQHACSMRSSMPAAYVLKVSIATRRRGGGGLKHFVELTAKQVTDDISGPCPLWDNSYQASSPNDAVLVLLR
jgi:hypothetical protein